MGRGIYEDRAARRIAHERTSRGWSYQALSDIMGQIGVPIDKSSIQRIEKGERRINVDELVAFAMLFRMPTDQLVQDEDIVDARDVRQNYKKWQTAVAALNRAEAEERALLTMLQRKVAKNPSTEATLEELVRDDAARAFASQLDGHDAGDREDTHAETWLRKVLDGAESLRSAWAADGEPKDV